jgi:peptidoglycan/LPS O-acetylase OafA/YrhL
LLFIGLFALLGSRRRIAIAAVALASASVGLRLVLASDDRYFQLFFQTPYRLDAVLIGCGLALWFVPVRRVWIGPVLLLAVVASGTRMNLLLFGMTMAVFGSAALISSAVTAPPRWLSWRPLVALGTISYGVYLWHVPFTIALDHTSAPLMVRFVVILAGGLLAAIASYRWIEQPFLRRKHARAAMPAQTIGP